MAKRARNTARGGGNRGTHGQDARATGNSPVGDYRHAGAKRKNNPPAKIAAEGTVPVVPKVQYAYNPHLPPVLRFDQHGKPDALPELLAKARRGPLSDDEARLLAEALRIHEPWLEWTGKREKPAFVVDPVALHIHERVSTQAILKVAARQDVQRSLFADPQQEYQEAVQFYRHDVAWSNRLILGDSLQVMSSLARREDLAGKVQMIYMDPPYGIKFASNFQPEVGKRDVKDKQEDLTREPEMVRAYRDTWHLGIHSYLSYLRDRLIVARELLADTGSIFVQISDENVHRVRCMLEEVFGTENFLGIITVNKAASQSSKMIASVNDFLLWFARDRERVKYHQLYLERPPIDDPSFRYICVESPTGELFDLSYAQKAGDAPIPEGQFLRLIATTSQTGSEQSRQPYDYEGRRFAPPGVRGWSTNREGLDRLGNAGRLAWFGTTLAYRRYHKDSSTTPITGLWTEVRSGGFQDVKVYVVQTATGIIERCLLMTTDPGDLVLDPTCGSGTTAYVAEQWGRRWITIDTSRVAIAIARQRLLTAKYDMYRVRQYEPGAQATGQPARLRSGLVSGQTPRLRSGLVSGRAGAGSESADLGVDPHAGFAYKTVPHVTLKSIAQNVALDPIFARHEPILDKALAAGNAALAKVTPEIRKRLGEKLYAKQKNEGKKAITDADRRRWELPEEGIRGSRDQGTKGFEHWTVPFDTDPEWPKELQDAVTAYRKAWRAKMDEVNAAIAASAEPEELVDQPETVRGIVRVTGPFTVEAVQPPEMTLSENLDAYTSEPGRLGPGAADPNRDREGADRGEALFAGEPDSLPEGFEPRTLRVVEPIGELEVANVTAYLDTMLRYLRADGVRFLNNKQMKWTRLEPLFESGRASGFHAEGRWVPVTNGGRSDPNRDREGAGPLADARGSDQADDGPNNVAVIFGPQYGPVTAQVVEEAIRQANRSGYEHLLVAGFSFDGASTGILSEGEEPGVFRGPGGRRLHVHFTHIRPDINPGMNGLLKESPQPGAGQLFTVFGLPRVRLNGPGAKDATWKPTKEDEPGAPPEGEYTVTMEGVDIYNPVTNEIASTGADKVAAWFLDSDFDGRTFCITQAFFPDRGAWEKLARVLNGKDGPIDAERFEALSGTTSLPFPPGKHRCVAVKVIDPRGNEVMRVERLD